MAESPTRLLLTVFLVSVFLITWNPIIILIILFPLGLVWFYRGLWTYRFLQNIRNMPTSRIGGLARGFVEIKGKVVPAQGTLKSPLTGHECVYHMYKIERLLGNVNKWELVSSHYLYLNFYLEDGTGKVLVNLRDAKVEIPGDYEVRSDGLIGVPPSVSMFVMGSVDDNNSILRFTEYFIAPGDSLYILGSVGENPFDVPENERLTTEDLSKLKGSKMISNDAARCKLEPEKGDCINHLHKLMIQKGDNDLYYVSDKPEHIIDAELRKKALWGIYGGTVISIMSIALILIQLKLL